ncbi:type II CRISPR RNA-guided endonuclease Cas9, partial [Mycoplasmopsis synoviae]
MENNNNKEKIVIGFDLGVASVGWSIVNAETKEVIDLGVRLFSEPEKADYRREKRTTRRLLRRKKFKREKFHKLILKNAEIFGLQSRNQILNVYKDQSSKYRNILKLKINALKEEIKPSELVWVLRDYLQNRGYFYKNEKLTDEFVSNSFPSKKLHEHYEKYGFFRGSVKLDNKLDNKKDKAKEKDEEESDAKKESEEFIFSNKQWINEIVKVFENQSYLTESFKEEYLKIFNYVRPFNKGPGSKNSRTAYGVFSTDIDPETNKFKDYSNIWDKTIGKCSLFEEEIRAPKNLPSALIFNLQNEICTIKNEFTEFKNWWLNAEQKSEILKFVFAELFNWKNKTYSDKKFNKNLQDKIKKYLLNFALENFNLNEEILKNRDLENNDTVLGLKGVKYYEKSNATADAALEFSSLKPLYVFIKFLKEKKLDLNYLLGLENTEILYFLDSIYLAISYSSDLKERNEWFKKLLKELYPKIKNNNLEIIENVEDIFEITDQEKFESFSKTHSLSKKAFNHIIPLLLSNNEGKNYESLKHSNEELKKRTEKAELKAQQNQKYLKDNFLKEALVPLSVKTSVLQAIKIFNQIIKNFGKKYEISQVVIEMARELTKPNLEKLLNNATNSNIKILKEKLDQTEKFDDFTKKKFIDKIENSVVFRNKLFLWFEQDRKDPYTQLDIKINEIEDETEIDHVIPYSKSADDSWFNKLLVKKSTNQLKKNKTVWEYYQNESDPEAKWNKFVAWAKRIYLVQKSDKESKDNSEKDSIFKNKKPNLKFKNITKKLFDPYKDLGFLARNLNDTRYATKVFRDQLNNYSKHHSKDDENKLFKVVCMNGSITSFLRKSMWRKNEEQVYRFNFWKKDRDQFFHHAVDASIIAIFSLLTKTLYNKLRVYESYDVQRREDGVYLINKETGEVKKADKDYWKDQHNFLKIRENAIEIKNVLNNVDFQNQVRYSRKANTKLNTQLFNETLYGVKEFENNFYKLEKVNLFSRKDLRKFILEDLNEESEKNKKTKNGSRKRILTEKYIVDEILQILENEEFKDSKSDINALNKYMDSLPSKFSEFFSQDFINKCKKENSLILTFDAIKHNDPKKVIKIKNLKFFREDATLKNKQAVHKDSKNQTKSFYESYKCVGFIWLKNKNDLKESIFVPINSRVIHFGDKDKDIFDFDSYNKEKLLNEINLKRPENKKFNSINEIEFVKFVKPSALLLNFEDQQIYYISTLISSSLKAEIKLLNKKMDKRKIVSM